jgi:hypothetical protein
MNRIYRSFRSAFALRCCTGLSSCGSSLGIFYQDSGAKKRWVLKFEDAQTLEHIDAVFVTVEPNGGSQKPSGKPLLFASLKIEPNHP